jgi:hypothetical protein
LPKTKGNKNNQSDELAKSLAQSVTRRGAMKKFGVGLAGMALACFGLASGYLAAAAELVPTANIMLEHDRLYYRPVSSSRRIKILPLGQTISTSLSPRWEQKTSKRSG